MKLWQNVQRQLTVTAQQVEGQIVQCVEEAVIEITIFIPHILHHILCTSQQKLDTNFKFFYSKDWFSVQCYGCLDTSLFGWLECIRYGVIVKPACAPLMRLRALQSLHT